MRIWIFGSGGNIFSDKSRKEDLADESLAKRVQWWRGGGAQKYKIRFTGRQKMQQCYDDNLNSNEIRDATSAKVLRNDSLMLLCNDTGYVITK